MAAKGGGKKLQKIVINRSPSEVQVEELFQTLKTRFEENPDRHPGVTWSAVGKKLESNPEAISSLYAMETTGGEPDVVELDEPEGGLVFIDCAAESPSGRRSICYDQEGQSEREKKAVHPAGNALALAETMGIVLLNEEQYRQLQTLGEFDTKTESWLLTPEKIRQLGGAIFGDRRFDHVFVFHNTAKSFYAARGFRGLLRL